MSTSRQDKEFLSEVVGDTLLESAVVWIQNHMAPDDVFSIADLKTWAEENGYHEKEK